MLNSNPQKQQIIKQIGDKIAGEKYLEARSITLEALAKFSDSAWFWHRLMLLDYELSKLNTCRKDEFIDEAISAGRKACELAPHDVKASIDLIDLLWVLERGFETVDEYGRFLSKQISEDHFEKAAGMAKWLIETKQWPEVLSYMFDKIPGLEEDSRIISIREANS